VLIKGLNLGGAERLLVDAIAYLDTRQFEYHLAYLLPWSDYLVPQFEGQGFPVHCLGMASNGSFPLAVPALHRLQREHRFELIHAHLPMTGFLARLIGRWHGVPVVYTEHNLLEHLHPLMLAATRRTYGWNDQVFAVSQGVRDSIGRMGLEGKTKVMTLLNGVPVEEVRAEAHDLEALREELEIPAGHLVVGTVAVLTGKKRLGDWLRVAASIADQREDVTFLLTGDGPESASLRAQVEDLGLSSRVRLPGFRADGRRILALLDLFLMTSEYEGLPIALLEAMTLGVPVVATAVGGIPEAVTDGQEGCLAPMGAVADLAGHALQLLSEPELRFKLGHNAAKRIEREFQIRARIKTVEGVYRHLLGIDHAFAT
jgi:glycosyltransferase involved in cell wall biosynthesis